MFTPHGYIAHCDPDTGFRSPLYYIAAACLYLLIEGVDLKRPDGWDKDKFSKIRLSLLSAESTLSVSVQHTISFARLGRLILTEYNGGILNEPQRALVRKFVEDTAKWASALEQP